MFRLHVNQTGFMGLLQEEGKADLGGGLSEGRSEGGEGSFWRRPFRGEKKANKGGNCREEGKWYKVPLR